MGYFYTDNDARLYEKWLQIPRNRAAVDLENWLMCKMLNPRRGDTALEIGCGTGEGLLSLLNMGVQVTGLDPSSPMLEIALEKLGNKADFHLGVAEDLPFDDNEFNCSCILNTLEFVENPRKALEEAFRVSKHKVFIGILNRHSSKAARLRMQRIFTQDIYQYARFFTVWEIKRMIRSLAGNVPIFWQTAYQLPQFISRPFRKTQRPLRYKDPMGEFIGMTVMLVPRFNTRLLHLRRHTTPFPGVITGLAREWRKNEGSISL